MPWPDLRPYREGVLLFTLYLLSLAMISFPFSVAVANLFLGLTLAAGLFGGLWWEGISRIWQHYRMIAVAIVLYLSLIPAGLWWSLDPDWGLKILGRHWFWLLLPVIVVVASGERYRNRLLGAVSLGLTANLVFCVLQANALIDSPTVAGSTPDNATGHIGHTGFGFIYGIWSAWLLHWALIHKGRAGIIAVLLALWAVVMVFLAEGQSGYIVCLVLFLVVMLKWAVELRAWQYLLAMLFIAVLAVTILALGPGKERIAGTWQVLTQAEQQQTSSTRSMAVASAQARLAWWKMSLDIWQESGFLGVGTGGFPAAVERWRQRNPVEFGEAGVAHPHNQYLITLVRFGVVGLAGLLFLLFVWVWHGLRKDWRDSSAWPLVALTGLALVLHGFVSTSLEEHFTTIFALILLGAGLSELKNNRELI